MPNRRLASESLIVSTFSHLSIVCFYEIEVVSRGKREGKIDFFLPSRYLSRRCQCCRPPHWRADGSPSLSPFQCPAGTALTFLDRSLRAAVFRPSRAAYRAQDRRE